MKLKEFIQRKQSSESEERSLWLKRWEKNVGNFFKWEGV